MLLATYEYVFFLKYRAVVLDKHPAFDTIKSQNDNSFKTLGRRTNFNELEMTLKLPTCDWLELDGLEADKSFVRIERVVSFDESRAVGNGKLGVVVLSLVIICQLWVEFTAWKSCFWSTFHGRE